MTRTRSGTGTGTGTGTSTTHDPKSTRASRGLVLSRALLAGAVGMVPVPWIDELLAGAVRAQLVRRIAALRQVDVDKNAVEMLATPGGGRILSAATFGAAAIGATRRTFRRIAASLLLVRRADEALQTFQLGTLFDHYCARHHVGFGLDGARAQTLRAAMDAAIRQARGEALGAAFKRALGAAAATARRVPRGVGALFRRKRGPLAAEQLDEPAETRIDRAASSNVIRRAMDAIDAELERSYLASLTAAFDALWTVVPGAAE
jgi:hypothetical protein